MDFREYTVVREGDELVVVGTIRDPINWDFTIRMCEDDLAGMLALVVWTPSQAPLDPRPRRTPRRGQEALAGGEG
jgi:hypothetical protein